MLLCPLHNPRLVRKIIYSSIFAVKLYRKYFIWKLSLNRLLINNLNLLKDSEKVDILYETKKYIETNSFTKLKAWL